MARVWCAIICLKRAYAPIAGSLRKWILPVPEKPIKKGHYEIRTLPTYMTEYLYSVKSNKDGSLEMDYAKLGRNTNIGEFDVRSVLEA
ncbi:hypothetical protein ACFFUP_12935 [Vibrio ostreicida]|uniref:hypothetical protein n=1 Tax=Vibrio ostreicida TaxID=526588 RepID=UPI00184AB860|nr:hypothetical protein [Vibrio ostreicida]